MFFFSKFVHLTHLPTKKDTKNKETRAETLGILELFDQKSLPGLRSAGDFQNTQNQCML